MSLNRFQKAKTIPIMWNILVFLLVGSVLQPLTIYCSSTSFKVKMDDGLESCCAKTSFSLEKCFGWNSTCSFQHRDMNVKIEILTIYKDNLEDFCTVLFLKISYFEED